MKITKRQLRRIISEVIQPRSKIDVYYEASLNPEEIAITDSYLKEDDGMWLETSAFEKLYNYFMDLGLIPYGVATGDTDEPDLWILAYIRGLN